MIKKILLSLILVFSIFTARAIAFDVPRFDFKDSHPEQIIVKFKPKTSLPQIKRLNKELEVKISKKLLLDQTFTIKIPEKQQERFLRLFSRSPLVEYAEPDLKMEVFEIPNDPEFSRQWGLQTIQAPDGWNLTHGVPKVKIAILDTGIDKNHPDLASKVEKWVNFSNSNTSDDLYGHGTHVAGIAAAKTNNKLGMAGLGWESRLLSVKVLNDNGGGYLSRVADGIKWAADNGAKVINLSLGTSKRPWGSTLENAVKYAWKKGVVLACAAGNNGSQSRSYPAYYKNCLAIAATDLNDQKPSWSSYGSWVDIAAPGDKIFSTFPNHSSKMGVKNYGYASGTSMATPHVAGLAALLFGSDETLINSQVRELIEENADHISGTGRYWQNGRINVYQSVLGLGSLSMPILVPTSTPTPTLESKQASEPTSTPTPTLTPTPTVTPTLTPTSTPTMTPKPTATPTPEKRRSRLCERWPRFCR